MTRKMLAYCILFLAVASPAWSADYYVSSSSVLTTWATCVDDGHPCTVPTAITNAVAGDTVHFASGVYNAGTGNGGDYRTPLWNPAHSGTIGSPIVFKSDVPLAAEITCTGAATPSVCVSIGANTTDYITWDGFKITADTQPIVYENYAIGFVLKNSEVVGYSESDEGNNVAGVMIIAGTAKIQNCYIHGCIDSRGVGYHNTAGLWTSGDVDLIVEHCTFANNTENIYSKYWSTNATYRFNLFLPPAAAGDMNCFVQNFAGPVVGMAWYQNVFIGGSGGLYVDVAQTTGAGNDVSVYNNSFCNVGVGVNTAYHNWSAWNNLNAISASGEVVNWPLAAGDPTYLDYNGYYASAGTMTFNGRMYDTPTCIKTSLATWQSDCSQEAHSVSSDPGFLNASGTWLLASDFKRASYTANGRGGAYATVMGAYITGSEQIGYSLLPANGPRLGNCSVSGTVQ